MQNSTGLRAESIESPLARASLSFATPELGEHVVLADPRSYRVQLRTEVADPAVVGVEVSLDAGRPRKLSPSHTTLTLGELLSEDAVLEPGSHWLFAAPLLASGLVPRASSGGGRVAAARRFFVGQNEQAADSRGAVWLRKPEGTYNGVKNTETVTFEAFVFSALGAPLEEPCTITLRSPSVTGELRLASPFALHEVPSGVYEVSASARAAATSTMYFTVNRELGVGP